MSALVRKTLILTLALVGSSVLADLSKRDADRARQAWMSGYLKIESAAKAVEEKKLMFALELYEEALATFQEVEVRFPGWNPDVVSFRINFCTERVRELREAVEVAAEKMSRPDLIRTVNRLRKQRDSFDEVKKKLQADLKAAQGQVAELQKQADALAAAQAEAASLRQTNEALESEKKVLAAAQEAKGAELAALQEKLAKAEADVVAGQAVRKELAERAAEVAAANGQVGELRKAQATLAKELAAAGEQAEALRAQIKDLEAAKGAAVQTSAALQASDAKRKELAAQLDSLGKTVEELRAGGGEKDTQIASLRLKNKAAEERASDAARRAEERASALAQATATVAEKDAKIKKLEALVEQTDAADIDALATQARTATADLRKTQARLAEVQKALLARTEAEKHLIAERNKQIEGEKEVARAKRARDEKLHGHLAAAAAATKAGKREEALQQLSQVLELDPDNAEATAHIGLVKAELGDDVEAERMLTKAYTLDPTNEDVVLRLGFVQLRQDRVFEAVGTLLNGAKLNPKRAEFRQYAGIACRSLGWPTASEMQLKEAFKLDPKSGDTAFNLAVLLATLDEPRTDEAKEWYKKALELGAPPNAGLENYFKEH